MPSKCPFLADQKVVKKASLEVQQDVIELTESGKGNNFIYLITSQIPYIHMSIKVSFS